MTILTVGESGYATISAALEAAGPEDVVEVQSGTYNERVAIRTAGLTLRAAAGHVPVLDGGYSREEARVSGDSWANLKYQAPTAAMGDMIAIRANGVVVAGLRIINSGGSGVSVGAFEDVVVADCKFEHIYGTAVLVNGGGGTARRVHILRNECNVGSVRIFNNSRVYNDPQGVSGGIKVGNAVDCEIVGNVVARWFGEGINIGKDTKRARVIDNLVYCSNHKGIYCNSAQGVVVADNTVFFAKDEEAHLWFDGEAPAALAVNDETTEFEPSTAITFERNRVINAGIPLQITGDDPAGVFQVVDNIFIWGDLTRKGVWIRGPYAGEMRGNIFHVLPGKPVTSGSPDGMVIGSNRWSIQPPAGWRGDGDVYGPLGLKAPEMMPTVGVDAFGMGQGYNLDLTNYQQAAVEPPDEPPPPPDPPQTGWARVREELTSISQGVGLARLELDQALARLAQLAESLKEE